MSRGLCYPGLLLDSHLVRTRPFQQQRWETLTSYLHFQTQNKSKLQECWCLKMNIAVYFVNETLWQSKYSRKCAWLMVFAAVIKMSWFLNCFRGQFKVGSGQHLAPRPQLGHPWHKPFRDCGLINLFGSVPMIGGNTYQLLVYVKPTKGKWWPEKAVWEGGGMVSWNLIRVRFIITWPS